MKLKNFLKSANRGVILASILVVLVAIYVVVDNSTFQSETDDIARVTEDYLDDYFKCMVASDDVIKNNGWTEESYREKSSEFSTLIEKYFTYSNYKNSVASMSYCTDRSEGEQNVSSLLSDFTTNYGYITEAEHSINDMKIKKYGPNGAIVSFTADYTLNCMGTIENLNCCLEYEGFDMELEDSSDKASSAKMLSTIYECSIDCEFILIRENGQWKLSTTTNYGTEYSSTAGGEQ